jgi:hypothetical protein
MEKPEWWKKPPRSSRVCYRCGHKYSSHIDVKCLKLVERKPKRIECNCRGFIKDKIEMDFMMKKRQKARLARKKRLAKRKRNARR